MTMTDNKVQAPTCPSWCVEHVTDAAGESREHVGTPVTVENVPDWAGVAGATVTFEVVPIQWESLVTSDGVVSREVEQVRLRVIGSSSPSMYLGGDAALRVGQALVKAAQSME